MEDQRLGSAVRAIRLRRGWRQVDASAAAGISRGAAMRIEAGDLETVAFGDVRRYARALGARFEGLLRWRGADLDRLLNRGHAQLHEATARWLRDIGGWFSLPEISFSHRGDRGVIDIVAWHAASRTLLVIELKTRIADVNDLMSRMDMPPSRADHCTRARLGATGRGDLGARRPGQDEFPNGRRPCRGPASEVPGRRPIDATLACGPGGRYRGPEFRATSPSERPSAQSDDAAPRPTTSVTLRSTVQGAGNAA